MRFSNSKLLLTFLVSVALLSGCGSSNKSSSSELRQWTPEEVKKVAALWMPAKTKECEAIVATFQEMQRVLGAEVLASTSEERATAKSDADTSTKGAVALMNLINSSTTDISIKTYTSKLISLLPKITQSSSTSNKKLLDTLAAWKDLIGNPPQSCRNEQK